MTVATAPPRVPAASLQVVRPRGPRATPSPAPLHCLRCKAPAPAWAWWSPCCDALTVPHGLAPVLPASVPVVSARTAAQYAAVGLPAPR